MSGGGGGSPQMMFMPSQQTTTNQLPQWVQDAGRDNYNVAANMSPDAFSVYQGTRVAEMNPNQLEAINGLSNNIGANNNIYASAQGNISSALSGLNGLQNYTPQNVSAGTVSADKVAYDKFDPTQLSKYMNPYIQDVINSSLRVMDQQKAGALNQNADLAARQSAFGNSRRNIMDAVTDAQYGMNAGSLAAGLYNQGFGHAMDSYSTDRGRNLHAGLSNQQTGLTASMANQDAEMKAALANQSAGLNAANMNNQLGINKANLGLTGAGLQGTLAGQQNADYINSANASLNASNQLYNNQQAQVDAQRQRYDEWQQSMLAPLNLRMQALGMTPYNTSTSSFGLQGQAYQPTSSNPMMGALGGGLAGAQFGPWGAAAGAGIGLLGSIRR